MKKITIYINPACSNCRRALSILEEKGIQANIIEYLNFPPNINDLRNMTRLGITPAELIRTKEAKWKDLDVNISAASTEELLNILSKNPDIMQRPIVVTKDKAIIARPPEKILEIL